MTIIQAMIHPIKAIPRRIRVNIKSPPNKSIKATGDKSVPFAEVSTPAPYFYRSVQSTHCRSMIYGHDN